jgi:hypothetical protein
MISGEVAGQRGFSGGTAAGRTSEEGALRLDGKKSGRNVFTGAALGPIVQVSLISEI